MLMDEILDKLVKLPLREIIGYAIASEDDTKAFYEGLAFKTGGLLRDFFQTLAKLEDSHKKTLLRLHETLFGDTDYTVPEGIPFAETSIRVDTVVNLVEAMRIALINEKTAERLYTHLEKRLPEHGIIFGFLAAQERSHYASIKSHVEYLEDVTEGKPEYINVPIEHLNTQLELYLAPHTRL
ncbi:ferritin family protein [Thermococcus sp. GR7]|nr:ferritin family protein [Thermococcus sp. GR7]